MIVRSNGLCWSLRKKRFLLRRANFLLSCANCTSLQNRLTAVGASFANASRYTSTASGQVRVLPVPRRRCREGQTHSQTRELPRDERSG